jgi:polyferredoxin
MNLIDRVKRILLQPKEEWQVISGEITTTSELYKNYIMLLAAVGPVASFIGMSIVGIGIPILGTFRVPFTTAIASTAVHYILGLIGVYILALIIDYLAPTFSGEKNMGQALKLSAYSYTAGWIAGIFVIIPALGILSILGLYSIYLLYTGIPLLMKAPQEKSLGYTVAVVIAAIIIFVVISWIPRAFISYPAPTGNVPGVSEKATQDMEKAAKDMQEAAKKMQEAASKIPQGGQMTAEQQKQMEAAVKKVQEEATKQTPPKKE